MPTKYKLPDWLGGGEVTGSRHARDSHGEPMVSVNIPGGGTQLLPAAVLTVWPPLLTEPADRIAVVGWDPDGKADTWTVYWRDDARASVDHPIRRWLCGSTDGVVDRQGWADIQAEHGHALMVLGGPPAFPKAGTR